MPHAKYLAGYISLIVLIVSCKKSESHDIKGNPTVIFFTNNESLGNAPVNSISYTVVNIPDVAGTGWVNLSTTMPPNIKFPVFASKPVSQDVEIRATLDNSLVDQYNAANNTNYTPLPSGILNTDGLVARIVSGGTVSVDSISIAVNLTGLGSLTSTAYMVPIKLTSVSNGAGEITSATTSRVTYVVVNIEQRRINYLANAGDVLGALITPRTSWTIDFTPAPIATSGGGSVLDGSNSSYSRWGQSTVQVDVNLQAARQVTGLRLFTSTSTNFIPTQVEVSLSTDGINYDVIGAPLRADLNFSSGYNYILFYKAITANYVRLNISYSTSTSSNNRRLAELDVYAN